MADGTAHLAPSSRDGVTITSALRDDMTPLRLTYSAEMAHTAWHAIANRGNDPGTNWLPMAYTWRRGPARPSVERPSSSGVGRVPLVDWSYLYDQEDTRSVLVPLVEHRFSFGEQEEPTAYWRRMPRYVLAEAREDGRAVAYTARWSRSA